ncbi:MAG: discoidin domain-containing protein [Acidobacteria bacterium]|nr:discoidin domain-containing protein [Acidobacteriota bacterium]MDW7983344.1 discoidin domain-containing protein [Acidobacteriota bacterium]
MDRRRWGWTLLIYTVLTLLYTMPLPFQLRSHLLKEGDAALAAWTVGWNAYQIWHDPRHIYQAPILYPHRYSLAFAENLILPSVVVSPLYILTQDPILTTNLLLLATFVVTGLSGFRLAYELSGHYWGSLLAGFLMAFNGFRFGHAPRLQLLMGFWIPLALYFLVRCLRTGRFSAWVGLVGAWVGQWLSCIYFGVFLTIALTVLMPVSLLLYWRQTTWRLSVRRLAGWVGIAGAGASVVAVVLRPYWVVHQTHRVAASADEIARYSASWANYWPLSGWPFPIPEGWGVRDPYFVASLAAYMLFPLALRGWTRWHWVPATVGAVALFASFGSQNPVYMALYDVLPILGATRAPSRWSYLVIVAVSVLAATGARVLAEWTRWGWRLVLGGLIGVLALGSAWYGPLTTESSWARVPAVYRWLAKASPGPVLELPAWDHLIVWLRYHFYTVIHRHPTIYGVVSYPPESVFLMVRMAGEWPGVPSWFVLKELGFRYVIIHRLHLVGTPSHEELLRSLAPFQGWIQSAFEVEDSTVLVLNTEALARDLPDSGQSLGRWTWDPSWRLAFNDRPDDSGDVLLDGNPDTVWYGPWDPHTTSLTLDLGRPHRVHAIAVLGERRDRTPFYFEGSLDGQSWQSIPAVPDGLWLNIPRLRQSPRKVYIFPPYRSWRYLRIYRAPSDARRVTLRDIAVAIAEP